ncbi:MAG: sigma-70 family RNA polymerase sigma factor [Myxococcales bacterium]|nr:sigma-70 family RNA polymerase sigma factor [Myxococcales bacterium]
MTERDPVAAARAGEIAAAEQMAAASRGDPEAFVRLCESYAPLLVGIALRILGERNEAEKAVHDVLVEAWRSCRIYDPARFSIRVWWTIGVRTMAHRRNQNRRVKRMASTHDTMIAQLATTVEAVDVPPMRRQVQRVLDAISAEQRSVLQLAYFDGLSAVEIANRSGLGVSAVRSQLAEALRCLRTGLYWIDAPTVTMADEFAAQYLLGELSFAERSACDLGDAVAGLDAQTSTSVRDSIHSLALYTLPGPGSPRIRARLLAAVTGPDRMQPFAVDLARFFGVDLDAAREYVGRVDRPHGWLDDAAGVRLLAINLSADPRVPEDMSDPPDEDDDALLTTMVQSPAWPATCLVRVAPGQSLGMRYTGHSAEVLVLQGSLVGSDGATTRPGELRSWPAGAALGTAGPGDVELLCAVLAAPAPRRAPGRTA